MGYDTFRELRRGENISQWATIKDYDGKEISDQRNIKKRWREYAGNNADHTEGPELDQEEMEPDQLESEVE
uniref:Uncharacterized protein n=1 Tax=Sphaerodactylus townsendi TaxID=933632 RepID=A0ACB8E6H9_9SAUR